MLDRALKFKLLLLPAIAEDIAQLSRGQRYFSGVVVLRNAGAISEVKQ